VHGEPFAEILAFWKLYSKAQVAGALNENQINPPEIASLVWERTSVASAYFLSWYCLVPSGTSLRGLKVRVFPLPKITNVSVGMPNKGLTSRRMST
jgi:hypothetical protein